MRLLLLACLLSVSAWPAESDLSRQLKAVESRYNNAKSLQVLFHEEYTPSGRMHKSDAGTLTLSKPGLMRWEYSQPKGKLWISDGKTSYKFFPDENRVERGPIKGSEDLGAPLAFLLGKLDFQKEFRNLQAKADGPDMRITGDSKSENLPYSSVEFVVTPEHRIRLVKVTGYDHSVLEFRLDQEKVDVSVPPETSLKPRLLSPFANA